MNEVDVEFLNLINELKDEYIPELSECSVHPKYISAITLQEIYDFGNTRLEEHLDEDDITGIPDDIADLAVDDSTISRKRKELKQSNGCILPKIKELSARIVFILYTEGENLPAEVLETYGLGDPPTLDKPQVDTETRHEAVRNWAEIFVNEFISPLTFNRTDPQYDYKRYIGLCAHSALQEISPSDVANTASYLYEPSNIPSGSSLTTNITDIAAENDEKYLPKELIEKLDSGDNLLDENSSGNERLDNYLPKELVNQFAECYQNFFEYASDMGVIQDKKRIAVDNTRAPTTSKGGKDSPLVAGSGSGRKPAKYGKHAWMYQFVAIADAESPFIWNVSPIYNTSELSIRMAKQMNTLSKLTDIDLDILVVDREYYQGDIVKVGREYFDDDWAIFAKGVGDVEDLLEGVQQGEIQTGKIDFASMDNPPHAFVYPNTNKSVEELDVQITLDQIEIQDGETVIDPENNPLYYRVTLEDDVDHKTHTGYLTDIEISEQNVRKIQSSYRRRKLIEPIFAQLKDTMMPYCESSDPAVRYYFMALGGLFYNMHALVTRSLSPEHGIPLDISGKELLSAIRDVCLR
jgi:hypothetical protein